MKKVNQILVSLMLIISEKIYRTVKGLKVVNTLDDDRNTTLMHSSKDEFSKSRYLWWNKIVRLPNTRSGKPVFVMMSTPNPNPVITATISAPESAEGRAQRAESIRDKGASTTYVTIPPSQLLALTPLIAAMRAAKGQAQVDYAWNQLNAALKLLMRIVQDYMDSHYAQSVLIAVHYGYHPKGKGGRHANVFQGAPGAVAGTIDMDFPTGQQGCCYDIRLYNDARTIFTRALPSDLAHAIIGGFVSGSLQNISVTQILHGVEQEESQIIAVRAK